MSERDEIVGEFLIESYENLDRLDADLVALEASPGARERLASVFRTIHTIKGTCGFLGFGKLEKVAHVGENLLSKLRDGELSLDGPTTTVLLSLVDAVRKMLKGIEQSGAEGDDDWSALVAAITRIQSGQAAAAPAAVPSAEARASAQPLPGATPAPATPAAAAAQPDAAAASGPPPQREAESAAPQLPLGQILIQNELAHPHAVDAALHMQALGDPRPIGKILVEHGLTDRAAVIEALDLQAEGSGAPGAASGPRAQPRPAESSAAPAAAGRDGAGSVADGSLRVDVALLDKLMNLVGELVLARNQILQFTTTQDDSAFVATSQRLNLITSELQEGVMKTRMQPIGNVWSKLPRLVRDVSVQCGKKVHVEMEGKDTELDKTIIEAIKDPLTHIVRNAVDHGIETPEQRLKAGKPEEGRLCLRAFHEGGKVNIEISDDGGGIDLARVREKAIAKNLISAERAARMNDRDLIELVFLPGFSTAAKVTNVSGRGVGMDVVKTNIEKIGGSVEVASVLGKSTTLKIKIPLTLAIIPALMVGCAQHHYAIPQVSLLELVRVEPEGDGPKIEFVHGAPVYRLRGRLLPLVYLEDSLGSATADAAERLARPTNIVVLQADEHQFGLVVDDINDTEEIVVKPLGKQLKGLSVFAGATILGDGSVALILDVLGIARAARLLSDLKDRTAAEAQAAAAQAAQAQQSLLVLQVGAAGRIAMPLAAVSRLEEVPATSLEQADGACVIQYRGEILQLVDLAELIGLPPASAERAEVLPVVVCADGGRTLGLIVERIVDIVEQTEAIKRRGSRPEIQGSMVIQGRVTDLLDVRAVFRSAAPELAHAMAA